MFFVNNINIDNFLLDLLEVVGSSFSFRRLDSLDTKIRLNFYMLKKFGGLLSRYALGMLKKEDVKKEFSKRFKRSLEIIEASSYESCVDVDFEPDRLALNAYLLSKNKQVI